MVRVNFQKTKEFSQLGNSEQIILATILMEQKVTHKRCCELTSLHSRDVTLILQKLIKKGFLVSEGTLKQKCYLLATQQTESVSDPVSYDLAEKSLLSLEYQEKNISTLLAELGIAHRTRFRRTYIHPALEAGLIELTVPDKPSSSKQKYKITALGKTFLAKRHN